MAIVGKRVIHPGGRRSTAEMCHLAGFQPGQQVLDVGCGVGTTAVEISRRFGCRVTAVDIDPLMLGRATANVQAAGVANVTVGKADIQALEFPDTAFDRVVIEAVTMFVDSTASGTGSRSVCRPGAGFWTTSSFIADPQRPRFVASVRGKSAQASASTRRTTGSCCISMPVSLASGTRSAPSP
jgi:2-polyprenyl-3-methyl-5-hydroxy-6-metoxy-1,4-benzoquinol methylase